MKRRLLQDLLVVAIFLSAVAAVIFIGLHQEPLPSPLFENGKFLELKLPWNDQTVKDPTDDFSPKDTQTVYYTPTGKKYHLYRDCTSLQNSKKIIGEAYGTVKNSERGLCSLCEKRHENE